MTVQESMSEGKGLGALCIFTPFEKCQKKKKKTADDSPGPEVINKNSCSTQLSMKF